MVPLGQTSKSPTGPASLTPCVSNFYNYQQMIMEKNGGAVMSDESMCLDVPTFQEKITNEASQTIRFMACNQMERQKWKFQDQQIGNYITFVLIVFPRKFPTDQSALEFLF